MLPFHLLNARSTRMFLDLDQLAHLIRRSFQLDCQFLETGGKAARPQHMGSEAQGRPIRWSRKAPILGSIPK